MGFSSLFFPPNLFTVRTHLGKNSSMFDISLIDTVVLHMKVFLICTSDIVL